MFFENEKRKKKKKDFKIYIIGAGAIGKALAVFLKTEGKNVTLIRGSVDNEPDVKEVIKVNNNDGYEFHQEIHVSTLSQLSEINGVVLVTAKTYGNEKIAGKLSTIKGKYSIVLLQNGLNVEKPFSGFDKVYRCVLFSTSQIMENGNISFKTVSTSPVGMKYGKTDKVRDIINEINTLHFEFYSEPDIDKYIWNKTIINCAFNSICPLLEVDNGIFKRNKEVEILAKKVIKECVDLSKEYGLDLDEKKIEEKLLFISNRAEGQLISTYEDLRKKRRTEIDNLNLEVARMADDIGKPELVKNTRLLGEMIKIKSELVMT